MQTNPPDNPYANYAPKVWSLYLDETEAEYKELVQLWKTSLDSLLVFVRVLILHFLGRNFYKFSGGFVRGSSDGVSPRKQKGITRRPPTGSPARNQTSSSERIFHVRISPLPTQHFLVLYQPLMVHKLDPHSCQRAQRSARERVG